MASHMNSSSSSDLGGHLNSLSLKNLFSSLSQFPSSNSLLITSRAVSKVLNYLTPFSALKERTGISKTVILDDINMLDTFSSFISEYKDLTVVVSGDVDGVQQIGRLYTLLERNKSVHINIIVQNLTGSILNQIYHTVPCNHRPILSTKAIEDGASSPVILSSQCRIVTWKVYPMLIHDLVFSTNMELGGIKAYFDDPLKAVSNLSNSLMDILGESSALQNTMKIKNVYAKGDHSSLLVSNIFKQKFPNFFSSKMTFNEHEFYTQKLSGNTDLVVLERSIDLFPVLLSQLNYMGLLDDTFGIEDDLNDILSTKDNLNDELFHSLKHLNFASIGLKLNKLAKMIQTELEQSNKSEDLEEIKQLVKNLGSLTSKQDLVRRHTSLSEQILKVIKCDTGSDGKFDARGSWLEFQNEIFDLDYKHQINKMFSMIDECVSFEVIMSLAILISLINDGLRKNDMETLMKSVQIHYGLSGVMTSRRLLELKIIKVSVKGNDFFGNFTFGKGEIETTTASTLNATTINPSRASVDFSFEDAGAVGISGSQDVYKSTYTLINKFWNLHPLEEEELDVSTIETVVDYKQPSFTLPSATVPIVTRVLESLYSRDFLKYKPVINTSKRPNWNNLNLDTMFKGQTIDRNICDTSDNRKMANNQTTTQQYVILILLGGVTRSEVSALQHLQGKLDQKILILTTGLVNNQKFWQAVV